MTSTISFDEVREHLRTRREIALLDVREEGPYSESHPLWAANMPLSRLEPDAWRRIPRRDTLIALYGEHEGKDLAPLAAKRLAELGYTRVHLLAGGLEGWRAAGGELFRDVNVPSKAFGEWVEHHHHTPSLSAQEVQALLDARADMVVLDARRYDEYHTMSIPTAISVPGRVVLRVRELAPDPGTRVIVNCVTARIPLIVYASHADFDDDILPFTPPEGLLGATDFLKRRVTLPFRRQHGRVPAHPAARDGARLPDQPAVRPLTFCSPRSATIPLPLWWTEGLAELWSAGRTPATR